MLSQGVDAIRVRMRTFTSTYGEQSREEIIHDIYLAILSLLERYKPEGKSFLTYLSRSLHFEMARRIKSYAMSLSLWHNNVTTYGDGGGSFINEDMIASDSPDPNNMAFDEIEDEFGYLKKDWIESSGEEIFDDLSAFEKHVLFLYYQENLNDKQISEKLGFHINTVNNKRREAGKKLSKIVQLPVKRDRKSGKRAWIAS